MCIQLKRVTYTAHNNNANAIIAYLSCASLHCHSLFLALLSSLLQLPCSSDWCLRGTRDLLDCIHILIDEPAQSPCLFISIEKVSTVDRTTTSTTGIIHSPDMTSTQNTYSLTNGPGCEKWMGSKTTHKRTRYALLSFLSLSLFSFFDPSQTSMLAAWWWCCFLAHPTIHSLNLSLPLCFFLLASSLCVFFLSKQMSFAQPFFFVNTPDHPAPTYALPFRYVDNWFAPSKLCFWNLPTKPLSLPRLFYFISPN